MFFRIVPVLKPLRYVLPAALTAFTCAPQGMAQVPAPLAQTYTCPKPVAMVATPVAASNVPPPPAPQVVAKPQDFEAERGRGFPRWSAFPPPPQNVPTAADIRARVTAVKATRDSYQTELKGLQWDQMDPEAYQVATLVRLDASKMAPIEVLSCEQILEFGRQKLKLATPPPIADN